MLIFLKIYQNEQKFYWTCPLVLRISESLQPTNLNTAQYEQKNWLVPPIDMSLECTTLKFHHDMDCKNILSKIKNQILS